MKRYFLMNAGAVYDSFLDTAQDLLQQNAGSIQLLQLQRKFDGALKDHPFKDPFRNEIKVELSSFNLLDAVQSLNNGTTKGITGTRMQLNGFDSFTVDIKVKWPVCLIFNRRCIAKYQLIFRLLFYLKHISRLFENLWSGLKLLRVIGIMSSCSNQSHVVRIKMYEFVKGLFNYMTNEVIEPNSIKLAKELNEAKTVDEVLSKHEEFLENTFRCCLLKDELALKQLFEILIICKSFSSFGEKQIQRWDTYNAKITKCSLNVDMRDMASQTIAERIRKDLNSSQYTEFIQRKNQDFENVLQRFFLQLRKGEVNLMELQDRLNFNKYYSTDLTGQTDHMQMASSMHFGK